MTACPVFVECDWYKKYQVYNLLQTWYIFMQNKGIRFVYQQWSTVLPTDCRVVDSKVPCARKITSRRTYNILAGLQICDHEQRLGKWARGEYVYILGIRIGPSAPMADRPCFQFSSSSERTTKRVVWGAGVGPARLSHAVHKKGKR